MPGAPWARPWTAGISCIDEVLDVIGRCGLDILALVTIDGVRLIAALRQPTQTAAMQRLPSPRSHRVAADLYRLSGLWQSVDRLVLPSTADCKLRFQPDSMLFGALRSLAAIISTTEHQLHLLREMNLTSTLIGRLTAPLLLNIRAHEGLHLHCWFVCDR